MNPIAMNPTDQPDRLSAINGLLKHGGVRLIPGTNQDQNRTPHHCILVLACVDNVDGVVPILALLMGGV